MTTTSPAEPEKLKPCPFCGVSTIGGSYPEKFISTGCFSSHDWFVSCRGCGCMKQGHRDEQAAITAWNTRTRDAARVAVLEKALAFYADPETYHGALFMFDRPTGGFDEDFDTEHGHEMYSRPMPGKLARAALAKDSNQ